MIFVTTHLTKLTSKIENCLLRLLFSHYYSSIRHSIPLRQESFSFFWDALKRLALSWLKSSRGTRIEEWRHHRKILNTWQITREEINAVKNLVLIECIFEKIVALKVLIAIGEDDSIFEVDGAGCEGMVIDDLVGGLGEKKIKVNVVFTSQILVNWLCFRTEYFGQRSIKLIHSSTYIIIYLKRPSSAPFKKLRFKPSM